MRQEPIEYPLIDDSRALRELCERIADVDLVALDTEFVRERTYYPELCVLQIATATSIAAVDCLAAIDLDPLLATLHSPDKSWLLHSARQDLEVLFNRAGKLPARLIDTQIAAALIGLPLQTGLQGLLEKTLGVTIGKEHTRADWSRRPLPGPLVRYALDDVRYLIPAWLELATELESRGRAAWFEEDCARQLAIPIEADLSTLLERTRGAGTLSGKRRAAAIALLDWRERRAKAKNRPRRWILADDQLVRIAQTLPGSPADLERIENLPPKLIASSGALLLTAIREAEPALDATDRPVPDKAVVKSIQAAVRARAEELDIQPELLATRREIAMAASGQLSESLSSGWRRSILDEILKPLVSGQER
ncbi:MAG TPA: HRDC domain-containing protein [Gammaproteobacteria bacterium]|nr:HRDC domain-containing protein [Gammaproteobacteria bacterium]